MPKNKNKNIQYYDNIKIELVEWNEEQDWHQFIINDFTQVFCGRRHFVDDSGELVEYTFVNSSLEFKKETDTMHYWIEDLAIDKMKPIEIIKLAIDELIL